MQGELAQAKNGDELFWEDKSHAANWKKAQACTQGALLYSFKVSGGKEFFFIFPWFTMSSHMFPSSSQCVPQIFIHRPHFYPMCYGNPKPTFHLYRWAKEEELYTSK